MPPRAFEDGPICSAPAAVASGWAADPVLRERANRLQKLVLPKKEGEVAIKTNRENMIFNVQVLEIYAKDLAARDRSSADPVEIIYEMVAAFYELHPLYPQHARDFDAKGWSYNAAWAIHKMISCLRNIVPKHNSVRVPCPS